MKARLIRIGNARGIRLPKAIIARLGFDNEVELQVEDRRLVIARAKTPRMGWAEAIQTMGGEPQRPMGSSTPTRFDETEWQW